MDASCMSNEATTPHAVNRRKVWSSSNTVAALRYLLGFLECANVTLSFIPFHSINIVMVISFHFTFHSTFYLLISLIHFAHDG
jgi:hypothetical protein